MLRRECHGNAMIVAGLKRSLAASGLIPLHHRLAHGRDLASRFLDSCSMRRFPLAAALRVRISTPVLNSQNSQQRN